MRSHNYKEFADADKAGLDVFFEQNMNTNLIGSMSQNVCERYLKDIIDNYYEDLFGEMSNEDLSIMHTHSLPRLMNFIETRMEISIPQELKMNLRAIDGLYFTTRYPGNESHILYDDEYEICKTTVNQCERFTKDVESELDRRLNIEHSECER